MNGNGDSKSADSSKDGVSWLEITAMVLAFAAFAPVAVWLYGALVQSQQLRDAVVVLVTVLLILAVEYGIRPHKPAFSRLSVQWLLGAYAAIIASKFLGIWGVFLALAGFSAALVAAGVACFDKKRYVYAAGGAFYAFTVLSFFVRAFDLPLRVLAGKLSVWILSLFNKSTALLVYGGDSPQIGIFVDGRSYLVATECNGFGIISGCVVMAVVCAIFRRGLSLVKRLAIVVLCALSAYLVNSLRIAAIVCLAPAVGRQNYHLMHETLGYLFFAAALLSVWQMARKL